MLFLETKIKFIFEMKFRFDAKISSIEVKILIKSKVCFRYNWFYNCLQDKNINCISQCKFASISHSIHIYFKIYKCFFHITYIFINSSTIFLSYLIVFYHQKYLFDILYAEKFKDKNIIYLKNIWGWNKELNLGCEDTRDPW